MENVNTLLSEISMEDLYKEFARRIQTEQEQKFHGVINTSGDHYRIGEQFRRTITR